MIVSNAGPILAFARANHFDLLRDVIQILIIPNAVYEEIVIRDVGRPGSEEVSRAEWIRRKHVSQRTVVKGFPKALHLGEREAIALAYARGDVLLIDDRAAQRVAEEYGVRCMGSLRVLEEAKDRALIPAIKPILDDLIFSGLYISASLYQSFLCHIGEEHTD